MPDHQLYSAVHSMMRCTESGHQRIWIKGLRASVTHTLFVFLHEVFHAVIQSLGVWCTASMGESGFLSWPHCLRSLWTPLHKEKMALFVQNLWSWDTVYPLCLDVSKISSILDVISRSFLTLLKQHSLCFFSLAVDWNASPFDWLWKLLL